MSEYLDRFTYGVAAVLPLDLRTTEQIAEDEAAELDGLREALTGLPARPGVTR